MHTVHNQTNPDSLRHWHRKIQQSPQKHWIIPIGKNKHWIHRIVNPDTQTIEVYNSLMELNLNPDFGPLKSILEDQDKKTWTIRTQRTQQQQNGYDCGVHVIAHTHRTVHNYFPPTNTTPSRPQLLQLLRHRTVATMYRENIVIPQIYTSPTSRKQKQPPRKSKHPKANRK